MVDTGTRGIDELLQQQLAVEPDVRVRAAMLGLDYDVINATAHRTLWGVSILPIVVAVLCLVAGLLSAPDRSILHDVLYVLPLTLLGLIPMAVTLLCLMLLGGLAALPDVPRLLSGLGIVNLVQLTGTAFVALVAPDDTSGRLIVFAGLVSTASLPGGVVANALALVLRSNPPALLATVRQFEAIPLWQTAIGGRARWIIASSCADLVAVVGFFFIVSASLALALPAGLLVIGAQVLAGFVGLRDNRIGWLAIQVVSALGIAVLAISVS